MSKSLTVLLGEDASTTLVEVARDDPEVRREVSRDLLTATDPARTNLLVVTYERSPDEWMSEWLGTVGESPANVGLISVGDRTRSTAARSSADPGLDTGSPITPVEDPADLTELGITVNRYLNRWDDDEHQSVLYFDSVTAMFQWVEEKRAYQFLQILKHRLEGTGRLGHFLVHPGAHDDATVDALETLLDVVVDETNAVEADTTARTELAVDDVLDVLSNDRRRYVLRALLAADCELTVDELVDRVADRESPPDETVGPERREDISVALYHDHLDRLDSAGLVDFEERTGTVELAAAARRLRPYLALSRDVDRE